MSKRDTEILKGGENVRAGIRTPTLIVCLYTFTTTTNPYDSGNLTDRSTRKIVAKYPHVDDYRRAILDMDEKQFINVRLVVLEMRNHFSTLYDIITKNIEKIKKPRNSNMEMLY
ncbi:proteasome activator pa28 beta subunit [Teladorsagia circumcincta]|uniref:Proteasome activator pa28 beta subunit n=1 Tax=Teladorsagia circumcincta TaxID=45464 RepID=A0A2G9V3I2_TELCI|nr:proteasome activator pa28 beta subunit [Teladorsagia circumcincta]